MLSTSHHFMEREKCFALGRIWFLGPQSGLEVRQPVQECERDQPEPSLAVCCSVSAGICPPRRQQVGWLLSEGEFPLLHEV